MEDTRSVSIQCWGTRGSIPTPGPTTARYGGNTSCVEVAAGDERIILDAGTGIRLLGERLREEQSPNDVTLFLSHFHWDHIQGFPFFAPGCDPESSIRILAPSPERTDAESIMRAQMDPAHFPVPYDELSAEINYHTLSEEGWQEAETRVTALRVRHASPTVGYRVEAFGRSLVFVPDNELVGGEYSTPDGWMDRMVTFASDADILIHDAMFTAEEYQSREGWGHSTFSQAFELAERAGVKALQFFHHSPHRSDAELDGITRHFREKAEARGLGMDVQAAEEGARLVLG
ncbi:MAG: MBL fold metallo-hydrolase [Gemmatimonadetes bacterium]|nr:MBL fold metallo-hydrolase [Gemmatimonadota bacterium]